MFVEVFNTLSITNLWGTQFRFAAANRCGFPPATRGVLVLDRDGTLERNCKAHLTRIGGLFWYCIGALRRFFLQYEHRDFFRAKIGLQVRNVYRLTERRFSARDNECSGRSVFVCFSPYAHHDLRVRADNFRVPLIFLQRYHVISALSIFVGLCVYGARVFRCFKECLQEVFLQRPLNDVEIADHIQQILSFFFGAVREACEDDSFECLIRYVFPFDVDVSFFAYHLAQDDFEPSAVRREAHAVAGTQSEIIRFVFVEYFAETVCDARELIHSYARLRDVQLILRVPTDCFDVIVAANKEDAVLRCSLLAFEFCIDAFLEAFRYWRAQYVVHRWKYSMSSSFPFDSSRVSH